MEIEITEIEAVLHQLAAAPHQIEEMISQAGEQASYFKPDEKSWSANEILAHLRACSDVWGESIRRMLDENHQTQPPISPRTWMRKTDYLVTGFQESFAVFKAQRQDLLATLENLNPEDWSRDATIKGRRHTVFSQARRLAYHEQDHCAQMASLLEKNQP